MPLNPATGEFYENMTSSVVIPPGLKPKGIAPKLKRRGWITPDFSSLKFMKAIPLFVYGTEKTDGTDHHFLEGAKLLGYGHTLSAKFWMKQTSINPIVFDSMSEENKDNKRVRGEIYEVQVEHLHMLDILHKNRICVRRTMRNVVAEDCRPVNAPTQRSTGLSIGKCHMYIGSKMYWKDYDLRLRATTSYVKEKGKEALVDIPFYEWYNWSQLEDENEWGWYGRWGRAGDESHVG
jgi:gamma-glutamylcyclotransferase (GGCT)/AIG2-like uncharacterized protein YtfP